MLSTLDPMDLKQIITLHRDGESNHSIGSTLGVFRNLIQLPSKMTDINSLFYVLSLLKNRMKGYYSGCLLSCFNFFYDKNILGEIRLKVGRLCAAGNLPHKHYAIQISISLNSEIILTEKNGEIIEFKNCLIKSNGTHQLSCETEHLTTTVLFVPRIMVG